MIYKKKDCMSKKNLLILYSNLGLGPKRISEPLEKKIKSFGHKCEILPFEFFFPKIISNYLSGSPKKYQYKQSFFRCDDTSFNSSKFIYFLIISRLLLVFPFSVRKVKKKLNSVNPDAIIVTSFLSAYFAIYWRNFFGKKYKIYGIMVDFYPAPIWYISIDKIFVANKLSKDILEENIDNSPSIHITGIPIPIKNDKNILPLNQRKEILLTGGGWGLGPIIEATRVLLSIDQISKINVICGDNLILKTQLENLFKKDIQNNRLNAFGFVSDIERFYMNTRLLITKAGGITLSEVPYFEIPMIITSVITTSEIQNRKFFLNAGACETADTIEELKNKVIELLNDEEKSHKLINNAKRLVHQESSNNIIKIILEDLSNEN